jgi:hypothetical protein
MHIRPRPHCSTVDKSRHDKIKSSPAAFRHFTIELGSQEGEGGELLELGRCIFCGTALSLPASAFAPGTSPTIAAHVATMLEGNCRICGCTDDRACPGRCWWVNESHTLCSTCYAEIFELPIPLVPTDKALELVGAILAPEEEVGNGR